MTDACLNGRKKAALDTGQTSGRELLEEYGMQLAAIQLGRWRRNSWGSRRIGQCPGAH
jgi:hypothetical protein